MGEKKKSRDKKNSKKWEATRAQLFVESTQDWAAIEEERILAKALVNDQQIVVVENLTTVENDQEEYFGSDDDIGGIESETGVLHPPPPRHTQIAHQ